MNVPPNLPPPPGFGAMRVPGRPPGVGVGPAARLVLNRRRQSDGSAPRGTTDDQHGAGSRAEVAASTLPVVGPLQEFEKTLRIWEARLIERERTAEEWETKLAEREREVAELEALLRAREKVLDAARQTRPPMATGLSTEEQAALMALKAELARQEEALLESKQAIKDREAFLEESENRLFEKVQAQQEKETELEQREEDVRARDRKLREREAQVDPTVAAALAAEKAQAATFDEFNE